MDIEQEVNSLSGRVTTVEHAMFGVGEDPYGGVLAEVRGLRHDLVSIAAEARDGIRMTYRLFIGAGGAIILAFVADLLTRS